MNDEIIIRKEDVIPYIYFVCSMAQHGKMYGGLSGKSDLMGGIFDRWVNIIPESIILNKYFLPKISERTGQKISVISDYYRYDPKKAGIAPDVFGIMVNNTAKPFVKFEDKWKPVDGAPQIEIKSIKKNHYMANLRDQGYKGKYLVIVETDLDSDYLLPFLEKELTAHKVYKKLKMDDDLFIKKDTNNYISPVMEVKRDNTNLGTMRLLTICLAEDFMKYANLCKKEVGPVSVKNVKITNLKKYSNTTPLSKFLTKNKDSGLYKWNENLIDKSGRYNMLDIAIRNIENLEYIRNSGSSVTVVAKGKSEINGYALEENKVYIIEFNKMKRGANSSDEFFMNKNLAKLIPNQEKALLDTIEKFIK